MPSISRINYKSPVAVHVLTILSLASFLTIALILVVLISEGQSMVYQQQQNMRVQILMYGLFGSMFGVCSLALDHISFKKYTVTQIQKLSGTNHD